MDNKSSIKTKVYIGAGTVDFLGNTTKQGAFGKLSVEFLKEVLEIAEEKGVDLVDLKVLPRKHKTKNDTSHSIKVLI